MKLQYRGPKRRDPYFDTHTQKFCSSNIISRETNLLLISYLLSESTFEKSSDELYKDKEIYN